MVEKKKISLKIAKRLFKSKSATEEFVKFLDIYSEYSDSGIDNVLLIYANYPEANTEVKNPETEKYYSYTLIKALLKSCPIKYANYDPETAVDKWDDDIIAKYVPQDKTIYIRKNLESDVFFKSFVVEIVIYFLSANEDLNTDENRFISQSVSYLLCKKYKIDVSDFEFTAFPKNYRKISKTIMMRKLLFMEALYHVLDKKIYLNIQSVLESYQKEKMHNRKQEKFDKEIKNEQLPKCFTVLHFNEKPNNISAIKKRYRELAKLFHPDRGGNGYFFGELTDAYNECLNYFE